MEALDPTAVGGRHIADAVPECRIAVLIPCYNEEVTIAQVVHGFRCALPSAEIYVYDNNSTDETVARAKEAGAIVRREPLQGKGNVVRRMFADIEADVYVLVDGDDTYDAASAPMLVETLLAGPLDMVNAVRVSTSQAAYRPGHRAGNRVLTGMVAWIFTNRCHDMLSGYRVFSRRFVKSFPGLSHGFEIETELTVHALELRTPIADVPTPYRERPAGSASKLNTFRDGLRILWIVLVLVKEERPLPFFSALALAFASASLLIAWPVLLTYVEEGLVPRLPTAVLSMGLMLLAFLSLTCGLVQETVTRGRQEMKRLRYLGISPPPASVSGTVSALAVPARREGPAAESPAPPPVPVAPVATVRGEGEELVGARTKARTPSAVFARFALVGTIGFLVDAAVLSLLLHGAGIGPYLSRVISYLIAATTTWRLHRSFTFSDASPMPVGRQWLRFVGVNAFGGGVNYGVYALLIGTGDASSAIQPVLAVAAGSLTALLLNFVLSRLLVFPEARTGGFALARQSTRP